MTRPQCRIAADFQASPNHGARAAGAAVDILLLHYTGMPDADEALAWLCNPKSQVSCHYFVHEDGRVVQLVDEDRRAWHAGKGSWRGETDINSRSIGIEIVNPGHEFGYRSFPEPQIEAVIALAKDICGRWTIPPDRVLGHSDVAPERKEDPGELFPWRQLADAGLALAVTPAPIRPGNVIQPGAVGPPVAALQAMLGDIGYGCPESGVYDDLTKAVVTAFQRRFRPEQVDGIADISTLETIRAVLQADGAA